MKLNEKSQILIVGLGLMGGSYAQALTAKGFSVWGIDSNEDSIFYALREKMIEKGWSYPNEHAIGMADVIIFALYPGVFKKWIEENQKYFSPGTLITDVTGVKDEIVDDIQSMLRPDVEFIAAHPMAGREVSGVENSDSGIFKGANYIVVPTEKNTADAIDNCKRLGQYLGFARVSELSPKEHDEMIGFVSQLTHCIAVTLMTCSDSTRLVDYTGDSFRDLTRIAKINDKMWAELFMMNREPLLRQMEKFGKEFYTFKKLLEEKDVEGMREKMRLSGERRTYFDK